MKSAFFFISAILLAVFLQAAQAATLTGFNQNWSYLPELDTPGMLDKIRALRPAMLRYPGGTIAHGWNWREGHPRARRGLATHPVGDIRRLADATGARFTIVLDIINSSLADQLAMLRAIQAKGVAIEHIELGNEVYAKEADYVRRFPGGADYAAAVNEWVPALRRAFPRAQIGVVLFDREVRASNVRMASWNAAVTSSLRVPVDAWIFHLYISEGADFAETRARFERVLSDTPLGGKPLWITEYGNQNTEDSPAYLDDLMKLTDYVEQRAGVEISLNHQITGAHKNKLSRDGLVFTPEGERFRQRAARVAAGRRDGS